MILTQIVNVLSQVSLTQLIQEQQLREQQDAFNISVTLVILKLQLQHPTYQPSLSFAIQVKWAFHYLLYIMVILLEISLVLEITIDSAIVKYA